MANQKQRTRNRDTARWLKEQKVCPRCGEKGRHHKVLPQSLVDIMNRVPAQEIWLCKPQYDRDKLKADVTAQGGVRPATVTVTAEDLHGIPRPMSGVSDGIYPLRQVDEDYFKRKVDKP